MDRLSSLQLRFLGGAQTVTGSKYLLSYQDKRILVDCGLFQGLKELRIKNWDRFPIDPRSIDAIILTHAHIDHSGFIPRLIKDGFRGKIHCTPATLELCRILLPDTGYLQEEEAEYLNRRKATKHAPALPLFTKEDAENSIPYFSATDFETEFQPVDGVKARFSYAGHILGAAHVTIKIAGRRISFSGDLGRMEDPIFFSPQPLGETDYLVVESTYGNRLHETTDAMEELANAVNKTASRHGVVLIPAFAVGRAQTLLYMLWQLRATKRIPNIPVYLNSPLAENATEIFYKFETLHKLDARDCMELSKQVSYIKTVDQSKALNEKHGPMIILSASGMATGGRILHHLNAFAPDPKNSIVLAGFQAAGTRGRALQDGAQSIRIFGQEVPVRADLFTIENLSAHADYSETLKWLSQSKAHPKKVFITHGEKEAALSLKEKITAKLKWTCEVPSQDQEVTLE